MGILGACGSSSTPIRVLERLRLSSKESGGRKGVSSCMGESFRDGLIRFTDTTGLGWEATGDGSGVLGAVAGSEAKISFIDLVMLLLPLRLVLLP